jgi:hypothetical protein
LSYNSAELQKLLLAAWQTLLIPGEFMTLDETRIPTHSRNIEGLSFNRNKPSKWALESHALNDVETAFLYNFDLPGQYSAFEALDKLTDCIGNQRLRRHVTADSHFGNITQLNLLTKKKLYGTFNCRANTKPSLLWKAGLGKGLPKWRSRFAKQGNVVAATFHSKAKLNILSSWFKVEEGEQSTGADRGVLLQHYDRTKRATDLFNHVVASYHYKHPHKDRSMTQLIGWIEWSLANGFLLHKHNEAKPLLHRKYLEKISEYLLYKN